MNKKRIIIMTDCATLNTGYARVGRFLAESFQEQYEVIYLPTNTTDTTSKETFSYTLLPFDPQSKNCVKTLPKVIEQYKPSLVITIGDFNNVAYAGKMCKDLNTKSLYYFPIEGENYPPETITVKQAGQVQEINFKQVLLHFDHIVAYSKFGKDQINNLLPGLVQDYVYHAYAPVFRPLDKYACRKTLLPTIITDKSAHNRKFIIGGVFRNMVRKGVDYFLKGCSTVVNKYDAYIFLVTDLNDTKGYNIKKMIKDYNLTGKIIILPTVGGKTGPTDDQMCEIYNSFDVLLAPSRAEGFGLPLIEAAACNTPVITTDYATPKELSACFENGFDTIPILHTEPIHTTGCEWAVLDHNEINTLLEKHICKDEENLEDRSLERDVEQFSEPTIKKQWLNLLASYDLQEYEYTPVTVTKTKYYSEKLVDSYMDSL